MSSGGRKIATTLLVSAIILSVYLSPATAESKDFFSRGAREFNKGNYQKASDLLTSVQEKEAENTYGIARLLAARSFLNLAKFRKSSSALEKARGSKNVLAYETNITQARLQLERGDLTSAKKFASRARENSVTDEEYAEALKILTSIFEKIEQYRDALSTGLELANRLELRFIGDERDQLLGDIYKYSLNMWPKNREDFENASRASDLLLRYGHEEKALKILGNFEGDWPGKLANRVKFKRARVQGFRMEKEIYGQSLLNELKKRNLPYKLSVKVDYYRNRLWKKIGYDNRARQGWKDLISNYPGSYYSKLALEKLIAAPLEDGEIKEARKLYEQWAGKVKTDVSSLNWKFLFENFEEKNYERASKLLSDIGNGEQRAKKLFWRHKLSSHTELGDFSKLSFIDEITCYPLDYYGLLAQEKGWCRGFFSLYNNFDRKKITEKEAFNHLLNGEGNDRTKEKLKLARSLKEIGLSDFSLARLDRLSSELNEPYYSIVKIYWERAAGDYRTGLHLAQNLFREMIKKGDTPPRNLLHLSFPRKYKDKVKAAAKEFSLPEEIIYAVIRQESAFNHLAYGSSGERGLMQIMPGTARGIAKSLELSDFSPADLYEPKVNIRMGTYYLKIQYDKFENLRLATTAYNAGGGNANNWLDKLDKEDVDLFVEKIPISYTNDYVKSVFKNYMVYRLMAN